MFRNLAVLLVVAALIAAPSVMAAETDTPFYACQVLASAKVQIASPVQGVLSDVMVERGQKVTVRQPIARLHGEVEEAQVALAEAKASSDALLRSKKSRLAFEERRVDRNKELVRKEFVSEIDIDQMRTDRDIAEMDVVQTSDSIRVARMELAQARAQLDIRTIRSPIDGVVTEKRLSPGEQVRDQPIVVIQRVDPLHVEVALPTSLFTQVKAGSKATITFDSPGLSPLVAGASLVDPVIDAASNTFGVRFVIDNKSNAIPAGVKCRLQFANSK